MWERHAGLQDIARNLIERKDRAMQDAWRAGRNGRF
jgi:hypothetical protein